MVLWLCVPITGLVVAQKQASLSPKMRWVQAGFGVLLLLELMMMVRNYLGGTSFSPLTYPLFQRLNALGLFVPYLEIASWLVVLAGFYAVLQELRLARLREDVSGW